VTGTWRHLSSADFWLAVADLAASASVSYETAGIVGYLARSRDHVFVLNLAPMPEEDCDPLLTALLC
jgi:hypothetical protein